MACSVAFCFLESRAQQFSTAKCGKFKKFQADAAKTARTHLLLRWFARLILEVCDAIQCLKNRAAGLGINGQVHIDGPK